MMSAEITAHILLTTLRRIESRGALETAHRAHQNCSQIFRYAVATGRAERDPSVDLRGALPPAKEKHHASITNPAEIGELMRSLEGYQGSFVTRCALQLAPLLFVRPGELRHAEWSEIELEKAEEFDASQVTQQQRWITDRRQRTTNVGDDEDEEHHVVGL